jgi:hypothetical protein
MLKACLPLLVDVHLERCTCRVVTLRQHEEHIGHVFIVRGTQQEKRRRIGGDLLRDAERARVDEDLEIRPRAHALDGVAGALVAIAGWIGDERRHLAARGPAHDTDAVGIDAPLGGARAHGAHGAADVLRGVVDGVGRAGFAEQPVLESERRDAETREILRGLDAFRVEHELAMTATRRDDDGGAVRLVRRREKHGERRIVDVLHPPVLGLLGFAATLLGAGRAVFPETNDRRIGAHLRFSECRHETGEQNACDGECAFHGRAPCHKKTENGTFRFTARKIGMSRFPFAFLRAKKSPAQGGAC